MLLSGLIFLVSLMVAHAPKRAKVGDMFAHVNPGQSDNPDQPARPFVMIYTVTEVKEGKAKKLCTALHADGSTQTYETWEDAFGLGQHDRRLR